MKRKQLKIGLLTACFACVGSFATAQSCGVESHAKACSCQSHKQCDNVGLLQVLNDAASSFEDRLAKMIPDLPEKNKKSSCSCAKCNSSSVNHYAPTRAPSPIHEAEVAPPIPQPVADPVPPPRSPAGVRTPELIPVPDKNVDPFKDESARRMRPIPARPANFQRSESTYGQNFDPQANLRAVKLSNEVSDVTSKPTTRHDLAFATSSRKSLSSIRLQTEPSPVPALNAGEVITASATEVNVVAKPYPVAEPSTPPAKIVEQGRPIVEPTYHNPLRNP